MNRIGVGNLTRTPAGTARHYLPGTAVKAECGAVIMRESKMNSRKPTSAAAGATKRILLAAAVTAALAVPLVAGAKTHLKSTSTYYKLGQAAEARQDYDAAFDDFQKCLEKNPQESRCTVALDRVRVTASSTHITKGRKLAAQGDLQNAVTEFLHAAEIDPSNEAAQQELARARQQQGEVTPSLAGLPVSPAAQQELDTIGAPAELKPISNEPLSLHMNENANVIYEAIGKAAGINVLFDPDFNAKRIQVDLNSVSLLDALRIVGVMSNTFWRPVTANTIFVAQNNAGKRKDLDEQAVQTFYLTNAWQQNDLNDVQTALRNLMPTAKAYGVASQNAIVMRGTPDELLLAQKIINDIDKPRGEVVVDIAVLEVSKNWERNLGLAWPSSVGVALQSSCVTANNCSTTTSSGSSSSSTDTTPTLYDLKNLKAQDFALTIGSSTLELLLTDNNTKVLQSPRIRATDAQKAVMKIGSKIPIATGSYQTGASTSTVSSLVNTQFQYQDVGVNIEMTPNIHYDHDVTLKIKIEVSSESGTETISGVTEPIISQRVVDQTIRLREGEASILGGIQNQQIENNWSGLPGLSSIPIIKYVFGNRDHVVQNDEIVFVIVPHIVRSQELSPSNLRVIDTGVGQQSVDLRHSAHAAAPAVAAPRPDAVRSTVGTLPAQSAVEAAPVMLAQLKADISANGSSASKLQTAPAAPAATTAVPPAALPAVPATPPGSPTAPTAMPAATHPTLMLNVPPVAPGVGASFQVPVVLNGVTDISSLALQLHYDPTKLALINTTAGDFLTRDGQPAPFISHSDVPGGNLIVGISRPQGTHGVSGTGVVCVLSFQTKAAGESSLSVTRASVNDSAQQQVTVQSSPATITVK
jgi:general secretion pathway protein D